MDATGLLSFSKLRQLAEQRGLALVLTGLSHEVSAPFDRGDFGDGQEVVRFFADLDHGLEWCEEAIIAVRDQSQGPLPPSSSKAALPDHVGAAEVGLPAGAEPTNGLIRAQLQALLPEGAPLERLLFCLQRQEFAPGDHLIRQGEEANRLYLIESGQVTAQLEADGQAPVRLETMRGGRVVGELAFYLGGMRTASVVADESSVVYCLSRETLDRLETEDPLAASLLHRAIVYLLGERVVHLIRAVQALQR
jgi:SulP family sulfate permease